MKFIKKFILLGLILFASINETNAQHLDGMFNSLIYKGITEKDGVLITLRVSSTCEHIKIPFMLLSNRISEIERSEDSIRIKDEDIVLFDILFGEPLLFYSDFNKQTGILADSVQLRSNALEYHIGRQIKELNFDIFEGYAHKIEAFIIQFEMNIADIKRYINKEYSLNIYSDLSSIRLGVLIDEKSKLADTLRKTQY